MDTAPTLVLVLILAVMAGIPGWLAFGFARRGKHEKAVVVFLSTVLVPLGVWWLSQAVINLMYDTGHYVGGQYQPGLSPLADATYDWLPGTAMILAFVALCVHWARQAQALGSTAQPGSPRASASSATTSPPPTEDRVRDQLQMLERLRDDGIITQEEFAAKRAQVLDRL